MVGMPESFLMLTNRRARQQEATTLYFVRTAYLSEFRSPSIFGIEVKCGDGGRVNESLCEIKVMIYS